jgi:cysteine-rich repeat protein
MTAQRLCSWLLPVALGFGPACFNPSRAPDFATNDAPEESSGDDDDVTTGDEASGDATSSSTSPDDLSESEGTAPESGSSGSESSTDTSTDGNGEIALDEDAYCGDGRVGDEEPCDDANDVDGDGCSGCTTDNGWSCGGEPSICSAQDCDPLVGCPAGLGCYPLEPAWACVPDNSGVEGQQGDPCDGFDQCSDGRICLGVDRYPDCDGPVGCCARICDLSAPVCSPAWECHALYGAGRAPDGFENVGVCL